MGYLTQLLPSGAYNVIIDGVNEIAVGEQLASLRARQRCAKRKEDFETTKTAYIKKTVRGQCCGVKLFTCCSAIGNNQKISFLFLET